MLKREFVRARDILLTRLFGPVRELSAGPGKPSRHFTAPATKGTKATVDSGHWEELFVTARDPLVATKPQLFYVVLELTRTHPQSAAWDTKLEDDFYKWTAYAESRLTTLCQKICQALRCGMFALWCDVLQCVTVSDTVSQRGTWRSDGLPR